MVFILTLISRRLQSLNFSQPWPYIDLLLALFLVIGFVVYLHRFPVFRVVLGIIFLVGCSLAAFFSGFIFTALVLGSASALITVSLPLIFAQEIRHYLEKLGRFPYIFLKKSVFSDKQKKQAFIRNLIGAVYSLAEYKVGGTLVIIRKTGLGETIESGVEIDAKFSSKLLSNLFFPKSPLHDGAVIIRHDRIIAAGCLLPISGDVKLDFPYGTRHKSGLSITRDTDAVVILVSEQRGEVSLAENGRFYPNLNRAELSEKLEQLL